MRRVQVGGLTVVALAMVVTLLCVGSADAAARSIGSYNWAGYAVRGPAMDAIVLEYTVPQVTCTDDDQALSIWAGFGGLLESSLVQAGMQVRCYGTVPRYRLFLQNTTGSGVSTEGPSVSPGDSVRVVVCPTPASSTTTATCLPGAPQAASYLTSVAVRAASSTSYQPWSQSLVPAAWVNTRREAECIVERPRDATTGAILDAPQFTAPAMRCQPYRSVTAPAVRVDIANGDADYTAYRLSIVSPLATTATSAPTTTPTTTTATPTTTTTPTTTSSPDSATPKAAPDAASRAPGRFQPGPLLGPGSTPHPFGPLGFGRLGPPLPAPASRAAHSDLTGSPLTRR